MKQRIKDLIERYRDIVQSQKNRKNKIYWKHVAGWNRDMWRGIPRKGTRQIPFTIAPDNSLWSHILKVDLRDYYTNPETYLETQLRIRIYQHEHFQDQTYFTDELYLWFGVITELSFFETPIEFYPQKEGWVTGTVLKSLDEVKNLAVPDFYTSGLMPRIHQYYEVMNEYADGKLRVMFPEWVRGPFCLATHLRGVQNILLDTMLQPDGVHRLMAFLVDAQKQWTAERKNFLGEDLNRCKLYNDEIDAPTISPQIYRELIFPYEKDLADHYGEITYWHSCGNTTKFLEQIQQLPNLKMFHCGPWTSYERAAQILGPDVTLDICVNPQADVVEASEEQMRRKLEQIRQACQGATFAIRADAFMIERAEELEGVLNKIHQWNRVASEVLSSEHV